MRMIASLAAIAAALSAVPALAQDRGAQDANSPQPAKDFVRQAEADFEKALVESAQAEWVYQTYINVDTEALTARGAAQLTNVMVANAGQAAKFAKLPGLDYDTTRKLARMRTMIVLPATTQQGAAEEVARLQARMQGVYGKGQGTLNGQPINGSDIEAAMGTNRNPAELKEMWTSWHDNVGKPIKADYTRLVQLANEGARELGYTDTGALWRSNYDMAPDDFSALTEKL